MGGLFVQMVEDLQAGSGSPSPHAVGIGLEVFRRQQLPQLLADIQPRRFSVHRPFAEAIEVEHIEHGRQLRQLREDVTSTRSTKMSSTRKYHTK